MKLDLEERLIRFAVTILEVSENLPNSRGGMHLSGQIARSGTAPALLYGEAQSTESRRDFIHKMKIGLKELRESRITLTIIKIKYLSNDCLDTTLIETNELISIFVKSIQTATKNLIQSKTQRQ
jgi:four helix bundle protein